jgi:hypothetical protein
MKIRQLSTTNKHGEEENRRMVYLVERSTKGMVIYLFASDPVEEVMEVGANADTARPEVGEASPVVSAALVSSTP